MAYQQQTTIPPTTCELCGAPIKYLRAGVSQTGRRYPEFWACSQRCGFTWQPPRPPAPARVAPQGEGFVPAVPAGVGTGTASQQILIALAQIKVTQQKILGILDALSNVAVIYPKDIGKETPAEEPPEPALPAEEEMQI